MNKTEGVLYVAFGDRYIKEVQRSAKSLKKAYPTIKVALVTDENLISDLFDKVIILNTFRSDGKKKSGFTYKILGLKESPFDKTVFIDTDTLISRPFPELFELLDYFELLGCLDDANDRFPLVDDKRLRACYLLNSGVLGYQMSDRMIDLFEQWKTSYEDNYESYHGDMDALTEAIVKCNVKLYPIPNIYNFIVYHINVLPPARVRIFHGRPFAKLLEVEKSIDQSRTQKVYIPEENTVTLNIGKGSFLKNHPSAYRIAKRIYDVLPNQARRLINPRKRD
jgi:hypothetical protein